MRENSLTPRLQPKPRMLYKYYKEEKYLELFKSGRIRLGSLQSYRNHKLGDRSDDQEGLLNAKNIGPYGPNGAQYAKRHHGEFGGSIFMFCLSNASNLTKFGQFRAEITDPKALLEKISTSISQYDVFYSEIIEVVYIDSNFDVADLSINEKCDLMISSKPNKYRDEEEVRLCFFVNERQIHDHIDIQLSP